MFSKTKTMYNEQKWSRNKSTLLSVKLDTLLNIAIFFLDYDYLYNQNYRIVCRLLRIVLTFGISSCFYYTTEADTSLLLISVSNGGDVFCTLGLHRKMSAPFGINFFRKLNSGGGRGSIYVIILSFMNIRSQPSAKIIVL